MLREIFHYTAIAIEKDKDIILTSHFNSQIHDVLIQLIGVFIERLIIIEISI